MLLVSTELQQSPIHGIGVFLTEPVRKDQVIWRFDSRIDRIFSVHEVEAMPDALQRFLKIYSTFHAELNVWVLCGDHGRHFNHSDKPNTHSMGIAFGDDIAAEDLPSGTELTSDYRTICDSIRLSGISYSQPHDFNLSRSPEASLSPMSSR